MPNLAAARVFALAFIAVGLTVLALGSGWVALRGSPLLAPTWVICSTGASFIIAGLLAGQWWSSRSLLSYGLAAMMMTLFGLIFGWIAFFGEHFQSRIGGIRIYWLPVSWWPRATFGLAALAFLALALFGWWQTLNYKR